MPDRQELMLEGGQHTLYSDEVWYLVSAARSGGIALEVRFQSDAPDRTGFPTCAGTELCVSKIGEEAVGRIHYVSEVELLAATRPSFVPDYVWQKATEECRKRVPPSTE